ncbi:VirB4 family type IV secretion/conjugal transfer ATPase [Advenella sp. EE-W14]|uniref:VirB4 family type IV secretion/conjugal transfer ATPase n=1 Tax=Advenella sp. EE-W14 TaxID=2722705 RepID=UPI00145C73A8|nr:VirB4 family type IV secretion/conjugal transfer ATPase [Advenella sp. EE-W14]
MRALTLNERRVSRFVPYSHHVTDQIIACENKEYLAVIKIGGRSADAADIAEQHDWIEALHNVLRGLPFGKLGLYSHIIRRRVNEYPESNFPQFFASKFDNDYRATFDNNSLIVNELYLTVLIHPVADPLLGTVASLEKANSKMLKAWQDESIEDLNSAIRSIKSALHHYDTEVLSIVDRDSYAFSEPAEFLAYLLSGRKQSIPVTNGYLYDALPSARPIFSRFGELGELRDIEGSRLFGMLEFRQYPKELRPGHLDALLSSPTEFIFSQSWGSFTPGAAKSMVKRHKKLLTDSNDDAKNQIRQLDLVSEDLTAGTLGLGDHHATLLIFGNETEKLRRDLANTVALLAAKSIISRPLEKALEAGYWAQLPGNWRWRPRPVPITSLNFLCMSSFHNQLTGKANGNPWGPATTMFKTHTGSPYFFSYHASTNEVDETGKRRVGNTMIIGMSGTGKTVLQGVLLAQAQKFGATAVIYDKDQGMQVLVLALRGKYFKLNLGTPTGWNPFQMIPTPRNVAFMRRLITFLAEMRGETVSTAQSKEISQAVEQMTRLIEIKNRSLSTLTTLLPNPYTTDGSSSIHARLLPWCQGGEYGWVFDNPMDLMNLDTPPGHNPIFGFDMTEFLEDDMVRAAATMYLQHRVHALHDGRRIINLIDECQHPLKDEHFQADMQDSARTIRKKNGVMALSTQEPEAIANNPVGPSLIQQSATLIFLPNPKAKKTTYMNEFGLTESEFNLIKSLGEASRRFVIKQGVNVTVAQLDLSGCEDALMVFSGSPDMADIAEKVISEVGDDPVDWLPIYFEKAKKHALK